MGNTRGHAGTCHTRDMRHYWQVAAGNVASGPNYSHLFLKHGLAFVGGDDQVALAEEVRAGDVLILNDGARNIVAAGLVVERGGRHGGSDDKAWVRDVEGSDLRAYLFVDWHAAESPLEVKGLTRSSIGRTNKAEHHTIAEALLKNPPLPIEPEPGEPTLLSYADIIADLQTQSKYVDPIATLAALENIQAVYREQAQEAQEWNEDETRDRLVKPLLTAFGWLKPEIKDTVKGQGLGRLLCCFPSMRSEKSLDVKVIECRRFSSGVDLSASQSNQIGKIFTGTRVLVVTNGVAMKLYSRPEVGAFKTDAGAYVNLARPAERCPSNPKLPGALTALRYLLKKV